MVIRADRLLIENDSGIIVSGSGPVTITTVSAARDINLGSNTDFDTALELSDPELDRIVTQNLTIGGILAGTITVSQDLTFAHNNVTLRGGDEIFINADITTPQSLAMFAVESISQDGVAYLTTNVLSAFVDSPDTDPLGGAFTLRNAVATFNTLNGNNDSDFLVGNFLANVFNGNGGSDVMIGSPDIFGTDVDTFNGGDGNDLIYADRLDIINGGAGSDAILAVNAFDFVIDMAATSLEVAQMDFGNDTINAVNQTVGVTVSASGGNDTLTGSAFDDVLFGGTGNDNIIGGNGNDGLVGDLGIDSLNGGDGNDLVYFDNLDSLVFGGAGSDSGYITSGGGTVVNTGASSLEFIQDLAGGNDTILGATMTTALIVSAGGGADTVDGSGFDDQFFGGAGNDNLSGNVGNDTLVGQTESDTISGGAGIDALYGNAGAGGDGAQDNFRFQHSGAANADAVYDFEHLIDKIDLTAFGSSFANVSIVDGGGNANVYLNGQLICIVVGAAGVLTAADFLM